MTYELQQSKQRYEDITAKQQELVRKAFKILTEKQEEHEDEFYQKLKLEEEEL